MEYPKRKHPRLASLDYSAPNIYFLTLCTRDRNRCLSRIVGRGLDPAVPRPPDHEPYLSAASCKLELTPWGKIAEQDLLDLPRHFDGVTILQYVIMPDHIHILLQLDAAGWAAGSRPRPTKPPNRERPRPAVPTMIGQYKSGVSRRCGHALWQNSYYDHVVRNEAELLEIRRYIENNPLQWLLDGKA
ncbi:MAG: hypothetical protein DBX91_16105 [Subdoligranulum variabile]|nr:MAG: hypothetical protein DBX91_16105 [Subdoligranulum variabile]